ncbi:MAG: alpha/beta fold hydrolase [Streptosporangiaceae bacterium]
MDILLIAGLWLDGSVWDEVVVQLEACGHRGIPVTLPGQGDGSTSATLADQSAAVVAAVDAAAGKPMVAGHSAACNLAWLAADARPEKISKVALIGGLPSPDGEAYADFFPIGGGAMPFPGWSEFEGPDSADLDDAAKQAIAAAAIPVPAGVARGVLRLADERRYGVPVALVCPEYTPAQAREWIEQGEVPELARAKAVSLIDIDSGHWPMVSAPAELARVLSLAAVPYTIRPLDSSTWAVFAELVERNNGIFGGCWCMGYHTDDSRDAARNRAGKQDRVRTDRAHAALVIDAGGAAQGWCQYGSPGELPRIKHRREYDKDPPPAADWRITCFFVDKKHRGQGIARAALEGALDQIAQLGGGRVEAISEVTAGREAPGRFLFSATVELFEDHGFSRVRRVGKHAWIVSRAVPAS